MLVLSRKKNESIKINHDITIVGDSWRARAFRAGPTTLARPPPPRKFPMNGPIGRSVSFPGVNAPPRPQFPNRSGMQKGGRRSARTRAHARAATDLGFWACLVGPAARRCAAAERPPRAARQQRRATRNPSRYR